MDNAYSDLENSVEKYFSKKASYTPSVRLQHAVKRSIDILLGTAGLALSLPLIGIMAAATLYDSGSPAFFRQERYGLRGKKLNISKIRVMHNGTEQKMLNGEISIEEVYQGHDHPVYTRFGKFLDYTHMNELPQLWNVIKGDMSIVGNRPISTNFIDEYKHIPDYFERFASKPGLFGYSQLQPRPQDPYEKAAKEIEYSRAYERGNVLKQDMKILLFTAQKYSHMLFGKKINKTIRSAEPKYSTAFLTVDVES